MSLSRTGALAWVMASAGALGVGAWALSQSTPGQTQLPCAPEDVRWVQEGGEGYATCAPAQPAQALPPAKAMALGLKPDLNAIGERELGSAAGVSRSLAKRIIEERKKRGAFQTWADVDAVPGVGPSKLQVLKQAFRLSEEP